MQLTGHKIHTATMNPDRKKLSRVFEAEGNCIADKRGRQTGKRGKRLMDLGLRILKIKMLWQIRSLCGRLPTVWEREQVFAETKKTPLSANALVTFLFL